MQLGLDKCAQVSDHAIAALGGCPRLVDVRLASCARVSDASIGRLVAGGRLTTLVRDCAIH